MKELPSVCPKHNGNEIFNYAVFLLAVVITFFLFTPHGNKYICVGQKEQNAPRGI